MSRSSFGPICFWLALSLVAAEEPTKTVPEQYKVAEIGYLGSVSLDRRFLAYGDGDSGEDHVFVLDLHTRERRQLTKSGIGEVGDILIAPEGKQVAYVWISKDGSRDLRIIGVDGLGLRILYRHANLRRINVLDWSLSGSFILVALWRKNGPFEIGTVSVVDGSLRVLKTFQQRPQFAWETTGRFSPDERYIAYDFPPRKSSPSRDIFVVSVQGGPEISRIEDPADDRLLNWTPDGKQLLFASNRSGTLDVWLIDIAHGRAQGSPRLVKANLGPVTGGNFTCDGAYYYSRQGWTNDLYVSTFDPVAGKLRAPEKLVGNVGWETSAEWSPDGRWLAFATGTGRTLDPFVLRIRSDETGAERRWRLDRLTRFGDHAFQPHWSADGDFLLVQGRQTDYEGSGLDSQGLYRISAQTGEVGPLMQTSTICPYDCVEWPVWSADGTVFLIRWLSWIDSIVARDLQTGREKKLYRVVSPSTVTHLAISPDSRRLAFLWWDFKSGKTILEVMPASGGEPRELHKLPAPELTGYGQPLFELAWAPDSLHIIYAVTTAGQKKFEFWRIAADGGEPQDLGLKMEGLLPFGISVHPDGRRITFTAGTPVREEVWVLEDFLRSVRSAK